MQNFEIKKSITAGVFSIFTIGLLTVLTYKTGLRTVGKIDIEAENKYIG